MSALDWVVLGSTLAAIVAYGLWRTRGRQDMSEFLRGGYREKWYTIGLSVMATQASAVTFLSTPGQAYQDGMRFVQFYFGLPLAMIVVSSVFIPRYFSLGVYTAYQFLETRFDRKTRQLTAFLFLLCRGLSAGITIYAPAIVLSSVLGWPLRLTCVLIGIVVIAYTALGGTRAVSHTQKHQMVVMMGGMALAFVLIVSGLPSAVSLSDALAIAGALGRLESIDVSLDPHARYTLWSGLVGGFFLALSYFGTDQSQVQRYLGGRSITESRLGLLFNGVFKVPMQAFILLVGVLVFVYYQVHQPPLFWNDAELARVERESPEAGQRLHALEQDHARLFAEKREEILRLRDVSRTDDQQEFARAAERVRTAQTKSDAVRREAKAVIAAAVPRANTQDADYVFLSFVMKNLPRGVIGLLLAVILCAAMSGVAGELSSLATTTVVDVYKLSIRPAASDRHYVLAAKLFTVGWGLAAILFATFASMVDNLIQAVNILGSLFYGTVLGIFLVGFFLRRVGGTAVFAAAILSEALVVYLFVATRVSFLWYNVVGCGAVVVLAWLFARMASVHRPSHSAAGS